MNWIRNRIIEESAKELQNEVDKMILEEKEMGFKFDRYIKNIETIGIEFLPDDSSQVDLRVITEEDVHLFHLEGKGIKIAADRYTELKAENFRLHKEQDELLEEIKQLKDLHNALVLEHDSLLEKYKEQEAKIADLQIEKARLEHEKKDISELKKKTDDENGDLKMLIDRTRNTAEKQEEFFLKKNKYLLDKLGVKEAECQTLKKDFDDLRKSLGVKSCEQCDKFKALMDECDRLEKENHELALKMRNQSKEIDKLEKRNKYLNQQIDEMVLNANKRKEEAANTDEEPSSRRDILRCAEKCVCGQREQDYGTPESNFQLIADLWNGYLFPSLEYNKDVISPLDVSMMMALLKIARIRNGGGTGDSFVDLAGYAACGGEINAQKKATKTN